MFPANSLCCELFLSFEFKYAGVIHRGQVVLTDDYGEQ